jgi:hypothetical protein
LSFVGAAGRELRSTFGGPALLKKAPAMHPFFSIRRALPTIAEMLNFPTEGTTAMV